MKVSELVGPLLDLWVAIADGDKIAPHYRTPDVMNGRYWLKMGIGSSVKECPFYSTHWRDGGRIVGGLIETGYIFMRNDPTGPVICVNAWGKMDGDTTLICAARTFVNSRLGAEVADTP